MGSSDILLSLETKLSNIRQFTTECCIYRVPTILREVNPEAYTPKLVSIGPFHRGKPRLQPMEVHKLQYLQYFLNKNPEKTIEFYVKILQGLEERARRCYHEDINNLTSDEFVEMMLIDGCFIIEFMLRDKMKPRDSNDFLSTASSLFSTLVDDMQLLENQLPFFVIESLFDLLNYNPNRQFFKERSFLNLTLQFFKERSLLRLDPFVTNQVKHFVDLLRRSYVPSSSERESPNGWDETFIQSATKLREAGIKFQNTPTRVLDISFNKGVFSIPPLYIDDATESHFRNLVAFDFFNGSINNHLTDYLLIMDCLINTSQDVALLRSSGIIKSLLGDNEEVACVINNLCKWLPCDSKFYYARLCVDVNEYCKQPWHLWRAKLKSDYFSNPWSIIAFVAAIVALICTLVQTFYTVFSYYH